MSTDISSKFIKAFWRYLFLEKGIKTSQPVSVLIAVLNRGDTVGFFEQAVKMLDILITDRLGD